MNDLKHALRRRTRASRPARWVPALAAAWLMAPLAGGESPAPVPDNAALHYWKAAALLPTPRTPTDLENRAFVERELGPLPPAIFSVVPEIGRWLLDQSDAMAALVDGGQAAVSLFDPARHGTQEPPDLAYLAMLKTLSFRALQVAKAYQYVDNPDRAALIYSALLGLAAHLDQERDLTAGIFAAELVQSVLVELEGFYSRSPPASAATIVNRHFSRTPGRMFRLGDYLRHARDQQSRWLLQDPRDVEERLRALYGNARHKPAVDQLLSLEPAAKADRLRTWVDDYRNRMEELAQAVDKPYPIGIERVRELDADKTRLKNASPTEAVNHLLSLLVPTMEQTFDRFTLAETHAAMLQALAAAALYRAELKSWPPRLEDAARFVGRELPRDPFTGLELQYKLVDRLPVLTTRVPRWMGRLPELVFNIELSQRLKNDARLLQSSTKTLRLRKLQAAAEPARPTAPAEKPARGGKP
jgi:hypothetical protein